MSSTPTQGIGGEAARSESKQGGAEGLRRTSARCISRGAAVPAVRRSERPPPPDVPTLGPRLYWRSSVILTMFGLYPPKRMFSQFASFASPRTCAPTREHRRGEGFHQRQGDAPSARCPALRRGRAPHRPRGSKRPLTLGSRSTKRSGWSVLSGDRGPQCRRQ